MTENGGRGCDGIALSRLPMSLPRMKVNDTFINSPLCHFVKVDIDME